MFAARGCIAGPEAFATPCFLDDKVIVTASLRFRNRNHFKNAGPDGVKYTDWEQTQTRLRPKSVQPDRHTPCLAGTLETQTREKGTRVVPYKGPQGARFFSGFWKGTRGSQKGITHHDKFFSGFFWGQGGRGLGDLREGTFFLESPHSHSVIFIRSESINFCISGNDSCTPRLSRPARLLWR